MPEDNEAYNSLLNRLYQYSQWPSTYRFKFIFKNNPHTAVEIESWFGTGVKTRYLQSSANKYLSLTIDVEMHSPEDVIEIYRKGAAIDGLVML